MQRTPYALPKYAITYRRSDGKMLTALRVDSLRSWHFGASDDIVIVNESTTLTVNYDIGTGRRAGGAQFVHVDGPVLDDDALDELAEDMERLAGSEFGPIATRFYRRAA
jgi:hypothetical protein